MSVGELHLDYSLVPRHEMEELLFETGVVRNCHRSARRAALSRPDPLIALVDRSYPAPSLDHAVERRNGSRDKGLNDHRPLSSELELSLVVDPGAGRRSG